MSPVSPLNNKIKQTLKTISCLLTKDPSLKWAIIGSTALMLRGVNLTPQDIDVLVIGKANAERAFNLLKDFAVKELKLIQGIKTPFHQAKFKINGYQIELVGELPGSPYQKVRNNLDIEWLNVENIKIPVVPLEQEKRAYQTIERLDKVRLIEKLINK